ncbi:MAG: hypothetical protein QW270_04760 [Candidatus Bathyarchaeia archaeon]
MERKVLVLIALAVVFLSVSVVSAYASILSNRPLYEGLLLEDCRDYVVVGESRTVEGDVSHTSILLYSKKYGYISVEMEFNEVTGRGYINVFSDNVGIIHADMLDPNRRKIVEPLTVVSAVSGVAGVGCLGTVVIKKKHGLW